MLLSLLASGCLKVPASDPVGPEPEQTAAPKQAAVLWAGRSPGELYERGEVRAFRIEQGGQLIGQSWGRYVGPDGDGHHVFETRIELLPPGLPVVRSQGQLVLDDDGMIVSGFERSVAAELTFLRNGDTLSISDGARTDEVAIDEHTAYVAHGAVLHTELMYGLRRLAADSLDWRVVPLSGGPPFAWSAQVERAPSEVGGEATIRTNLGERITIQGGRLLALEAEGAAQRVVPDPVPKWPDWSVEAPKKLTYTPPPDATFSIEPIEIEGRGEEPTLAAEVLVPEGAQTDPRPGVVFLSRMAGEDRYGFSTPPPVDVGSHEIHDALAQAGFVVLRFDERGTGASENAVASFEQQVADARRAYAMLVVQPSVDPDRVLVIGHGEGGLRALALSAQEGEHLSGVALLASPGRRYEDVLRHQAKRRLEGAHPEVAKRALEEQDQMLADLRAGTPPPELAVHAQWLSEILALDPAKLVAQQRVPLLIVQGGKDFEVDPKLDAGSLVRAAKKHRVAHEVLRYPALDHLLKPEPETSSPQRYLEDRRVDAEAIADLVDWARRVTKRKPGRKRTPAKPG